MVGLGDLARKTAGSFSLGMGQRLGIASALLADPDTIILDEPINGLDPGGIRWVRERLRDLAGQGRTVLLSSHLMSELELTADHVLILGRGRLIADLSMDELRRSAATDRVLVRTPDAEQLRAAVAGPDITITSRVLILTTFDLDEYAFAALRAGASGFLLKDVRPDELCTAIRAIAAGDAVVSPRITRELLNRHAAGLGVVEDTENQSRTHSRTSPHANVRSYSRSPPDTPTPRSRNGSCCPRPR